jgi:hypothetical protein
MQALLVDRAFCQRRRLEPRFGDGPAAVDRQAEGELGGAAWAAVGQERDCVVVDRGPLGSHGRRDLMEPRAS